MEAGSQVVRLCLSVFTGDALLALGGKSVAHRESRVQVPDVFQPAKAGVIETDDDRFFVNGHPVVRGG